MKHFPYRSRRAAALRPLLRRGLYPLSLFLASLPVGRDEEENEALKKQHPLSPSPSPPRLLFFCLAAYPVALHFSLSLTACPTLLLSSVEGEEEATILMQIRSLRVSTSGSGWRSQNIKLAGRPSPILLCNVRLSKT